VQRAAVVILVLSFGAVLAADRAKLDPRAYLLELERLGARKPFLIDSPDVYLERRSLNRFFTERIYRQLQGNVYFGYDFDEGFRFEGKEVDVEILRDLTPGEACRAAYALALQQALVAAGLKGNSAASCRIGVCIVGMEPQETTKTLPGVMVEAYLRNSRLKKSYFTRFGAGSPRGLAAAIRLSAEMLMARLVTHR
jgi:hypothetical protein